MTQALTVIQLAHGIIMVAQYSSMYGAASFVSWILMDVFVI